MSFNSHTKPGQLRQKQNWLSRTLLLAPFLLLLVIALGPRAQAQQPDPEPTPVPLTVEKTPAQGKTDGPKSGQASRANALQSTVPTSTTIELQVQDYYTGDPITDYQFLVNVDNTGDPIGDDPNKMSSTTPMASHSPVVLTGVVTPTIAAGYTFTLPDPPAGDADKYLVTVRAGGYKLGGEHINVIDGFPTNPTTVVVELIPHPLPLSKIRVHVFHDNHPVNGENDVPVEQGLEGFHVSVHDTAGEVTVDWWGNPLCTRYDGVPPNNPQPDPFCQTDASGDLVIDNLPRGKYEVIVIPPDGSDWVQTTTIEGTPVIDAWIEEGNSGYSPREGFQAAGVWVGFVSPMQFGDPGNVAAGSGVISGTVKTIEEWTPPEPPAPALVLTDPVGRPWIALTDIGNTDNQVYLGRGNPDGSFTINNVPDGLYQMAIWDENLDYIIAFYTVQLPEPPTFDVDGDPRTVNMNAMNPNGDGVGVPRWFGWFSGYIFLDDNRNGLRDPGEQTLPNADLTMRFRDGSVRYGAVTDGSGFYEFPEVFELEKFYVTEVGFTNMGFTGALVHNPLNGRPGPNNTVYPPYSPNDPSTYTHIDDALTVSNLNWAAKRTTVDWGKHIYQAGENGGISGIVYYATTRNEFDAHLQAVEDYEPGIPNVTVRLYGLRPGGHPDNPDDYDVLLNETTTDGWEHPTGCDTTNSLGEPIPDPLNMGPNCTEVPNISNEVKPGVFDGGYAFATIISPTFTAAITEEIPMPKGDYVVQVVPPAGYRVVTEEDLNTADGNDLIPALPPSGCVGPQDLRNVPDQYDSPFDAFLDDGTPIPGVGPTPLCNRKLVTLREKQNAAADFHLMTDNAVPIPGRIFGFLLDDLNIETDPNRIYYGEKRGVPHTSVGVRDFTGRLITMLETDANGIFEVLLPSTYTADCPIPSGVCPAMYTVVGNDPGDPGNPSPHYNPNYQSIAFVFDVWPGKTTYADVAVFPITAFTAFPGSQFGYPAQCTLPDTTPQLYAVSTPYGPAGTQVIITGNGFGPNPTVEIGGVAYPVTGAGDLDPNTTDVISVDTTGAPAGPAQLLVKANGQTSRTGLTFHVIGGAYTPPVVQVFPPATPGVDTPLQDAIDAAADGTLIVVNAGNYVEPINLTKGVKLQGVGPGAPDGLGSGGSHLNQRFILGPVGINVAGGAVPFTDAFNPQMDGFLISGARDEQDVGGGIHVDSNATFFEISNNVIRSNGGNFGGGITLGEPYLGDRNNDFIRIHHNRVIHNGGISLAGGIGIFNGADYYEIDNNDICGNYSGEYGGGISHFGLSHNGSIHHNRIYYNNAFDEGGGIIIAGELPTPPEPGLPLPPNALTDGAGAVDIYNNLIQGNLSNDDGGGIRLLQPLDFSINIYNNMVVNNASTDMGGGISLDDASNVTIVNNTIAKNANTSTAEDSDGLPHAAGLVSENYSVPFISYLLTRYGSAAPLFPDPVMFNNIFWDNQAYTWDGNALNLDSIIDMEVFGVPGTLTGHPTNLVGVDPLFAAPFDTVMNAVAFRMEPNFVDVRMVTVNLAPELLGDYHILPGSPAENAGADNVNGTGAPCDDIDGDGRPYGPVGNPVHDIGADELPDAELGSCTPPGLALNVNVTAATPNPVASLPGGVVVFNHLIENIGDLTDAYNLALSVTASDGSTWSASVDPLSTAPVDPVGNAPMTVTVNVPAGAISGTVATVRVTATSQTDPNVFSAAVDTVTVFTVPVLALPAADIYMSFDKSLSANIGSLTNVGNEDIVGFVQALDDYVMVFDGSDVGITGIDVNAFDILQDNSILMSFRSATLLAGAGWVDDSDIVRFTPTSLGDVTAGSFSLFLNGSDVGLTTLHEDVDGLTLLEGDMLLISTSGPARVPVTVPPPAGRLECGNGTQICASDEDLLLYKMGDANDPAVEGDWFMYFDSSKIGLDWDGGEDVDGFYVNPDGNTIHLTTKGNFGVPQTPILTGADEDIFTCQGARPRQVSSCTGFATLFTGAAHGIDDKNGNDINGIDLP